MTFFNIFSDKKDEKKAKYKVVVDYREKNSLVPSELVKQGFEVEFAQLQVADYLVDDVAIERKSVSDLKSSIINKRIFYQMMELKQYPIHLLIIEGINEESIRSGVIHENALRGFLLSAQLDYRIPVIFSEDEKETALYLLLLAKKKPDKEISIRAKKISLSKAEQIQYILEGFPYIGPVKAKKLIEKFGSIKNIINANEEDLKPILSKKAKDFKELLD